MKLGKVIVIIKKSDCTERIGLKEVNLILKGGRGSGDFGHVGRAGKRGGSGGGGGKGKSRKGRRSREVLDKEIERNKKKKSKSGIGVVDARQVSRQEMQVQYKDWQAGLNQKELRDVRSYQEWSGDINHFLRTGEDPEGIKGQILNIDSALEKFSLPEDTLLYRTTSLRTYTNNLGDDPSKWVGKTFSDKAFLSTSIDQDQALSTSLRAEQLLAVISAPKGTKGGYLDGLAKTEFPEMDADFNNQQEILLSRGTNMRVTKVELDDQNNVKTIRIEVIN